jgi:IclR family transcriptional regulator, pca regulon regulatory protein
VDDNPKNIVQSVAKAFAVLKAFVGDVAELTISDVAARAGLDRATAFRLINTLCLLGYLASVPGSKRYRLTLKCLDLGYLALSGTDLKVLARPLLAEMVPEYSDAASLGILDGTDVVYVERAQSASARLPLDRRTGSRTGAYGAALGHAILAFLPRERQREIVLSSNLVRMSEKTLIDPAAILQRLAEVKSRGYAISDGENAYGLRTVAAPILDADRLPIASVSLTIHVDRMDIEAFCIRTAPEALRIAAELSVAVTRSFGAVAVRR